MGTYLNLNLVKLKLDWWGLQVGQGRGCGPGEPCLGLTHESLISALFIRGVSTITIWPTTPRSTPTKLGRFPPIVWRGGRGAWGGARGDGPSGDERHLLRFMRRLDDTYNVGL